MAAFQQGMGLGMQAAQVGFERRAAKDRTAIAEREMMNREMDTLADAKRRAALGDSMAMEVEAKKRDLVNYVEADTAFKKFSDVTASIDWSSPNARREYEQAVRLHLPSVLKSQDVASKWEAYHTVTMQNQAFTDAKIVEIQKQQLARSAMDAGLGPAGSAIVAEVQSGKLSPTEGLSRLSVLMDERDAKLFEREKELAGIRHPDRMPVERAPDYDRATTPAESMEMKDLARMIENDQMALDKMAPGGALPKEPENRRKAMAVMARLKNLRDRARDLSAIIQRRAEGGGGEAAGSGATAIGSGRKYRVEIQSQPAAAAPVPAAGP